MVEANDRHGDTSSRRLDNDLTVPPRWRRYVPSWLRGLIWIDEANRYDAFLSYSWKADSDIAPLLQSVIQQFLRPWYRLRAKTAFRDLSCLPAGARVEDELRTRMDRSECLVVLASPEAATSRGMDIEAAHWARTRRQDDVVVVVTRGSYIEWHEIRSTLLPASLAS